jgi:hypothetical protein
VHKSRWQFVNAFSEERGIKAWVAGHVDCLAVRPNITCDGTWRFAAKQITRGLFFSFVSGSVPPVVLEFYVWLTTGMRHASHSKATHA